MSLRVLWYEFLSRRDAKREDGIGAYDFSCFRCDDCSGCHCCWPPGQCHSRASHPEGER